MSVELLAVLIVGLAIAVVIALFAVMWRERTSARDARVAIVAALALAAWAALVATLALRGAFVQPNERATPPIGIAIVAAFAALAASLLGSPTLRRLLCNQANLVRLNIWRLVGAVFLVLMSTGQMPALWALPTGIGDILIGAAAFPVAASLQKPGGRRRAVIFNVLGLLDLVVAIGLGMTTSPGPVQFFHTTPPSVMAAQFPLALVPTFLVPLAVTIHVLSLWQLSGDSRARDVECASVRHQA